MMLISIAEAGKSGANEQVFRTSSVGDLIMFGIFLVLLLAASGTYILKLIQGDAGFWWHIAFIWFGFWFGLMAMLSRTRLKASLLPSNWLVKTNWEGVLIKFRSFQNHHYAESDLAVIHLAWNDMDWARKSSEISRKQESDGVLTEYWTYLDIHLNLPQAELAVIGQGLEKERKEWLMSTIKYQDYPVRLINGGILRIRWNGIRPRIAGALNLLAGKIQIEHEFDFTTDTTDAAVNSPSDEELDNMIRERIEKGDTFDASVLLQKHRGYTTTQAIQYIDKFAATPTRHQEMIDP